MPWSRCASQVLAKRDTLPSTGELLKASVVRWSGGPVVTKRGLVELY